ncbi:MAG TPA: NADH-quinone oxidoreductase subunit J [Thermodesulfovibrionales bacterium]|nr:NADH-quinone oxidoreductase subunit J [Thermodesulfovibrionales bacterium]
MNVLFYSAAAVAAVSTLMVITRVNAVHALLYLIVSLISVALIFFILGAPFAAALEVIIYAGAIMVLFVFVIMMLNIGPQTARQERAWLHPGTWVGPAILSLILLAELVSILTQSRGRSLAIAVLEPGQIGTALFGPYLIGVELASMLLLSGIVGAFHLGRKSARKRDGGRE